MRKTSCLLALVLLCGVGQASVSRADDSCFIGHLPEGTVELLGITNFPPTNRSRWWRPDGSAAQFGPYRPLKPARHWRKYAGRKRLTFLVRFKSRPAEYLPTEQPSYGKSEYDQSARDQDWPNLDFPHWGINGQFPPGPPSVLWWEGNAVVDAHGNRVPDYKMWTAVFGPFVESVDLQLLIGTGQWETVIIRKPDSTGTSSVTLDGQEWTLTFQTFHKGSADTTRVKMPIHWLDFYSEWNMRLVAFASDGSEHASYISTVGDKKSARPFSTAYHCPR